jgi:sugar lactone lactonase YvrE
MYQYNLLARRRAALRTALAAVLLAGALTACSGSADLPQPLAQEPPSAQVPVITSQPAAMTVQVGATARFSVSASGTAPLAYQWQRGGTALAGATSASYTIPAAVTGDNGATFSVVVSNAVGSVTSNAAVLTVNVPSTLSITQQPANLTVSSGTAATFASAATCSAGSVSWQWQRSNDNGLAFTNIAAATTSSYTFTTAIADNGAAFRAVASCGTITQPTQVAVLTVTPATSAALTELPVGLAPSMPLFGAAGVVIDAAGDLYVAESSGNDIRRIGTDGSITTFAGAADQSAGAADGTGTAAKFSQPTAEAIGADGSIYVTDTANHTVRRIAATGAVTTLAGTAGASGSTDGQGAAARFNTPLGITFGSDGALYVADAGNHTIRRLALDGTVTTIAGTAGTSGSADGSGAGASFGDLEGLVGDSSGNLYIADMSNNKIRKSTLAGSVTTLAGNGGTTASDGIGTAAGIPFPGGLALSNGNLLVAALAGPITATRSNWGQVRQIHLADGTVTTIAGVATESQDLSESLIADGTQTQAAFVFGGEPTSDPIASNLSGMAVAGDGGLYVTDPGNSSLRQIDVSGVTTTVVHSSLQQALLPPVGGDVTHAALGEGGAEIWLATDPAGNVVASDSGGFDVRRIALTGVVSPIAGLHDVQSFFDARGSAALFDLPNGVSCKTDGTIAIVDSAAPAIRQIATDGTVTTLAGANHNFGTADGTGAAAQFQTPTVMVRDSTGALYVADSAGTTIRRVSTSGVVTTIAGTPGVRGSSDGTGAAASFSEIRSLAIDASDLIYVGDASIGIGRNGSIRKVTSAGVVTTLTNGGAAQLGPEGLAVGSDGTVYVADVNNNQIAAVSPGGVISTLVPPATIAPIKLTGGMVLLGPKKFAVSGLRNFGGQPYGSVYVATVP